MSPGYLTHSVTLIIPQWRSSIITVIKMFCWSLLLLWLLQYSPSIPSHIWAHAHLVCVQMNSDSFLFLFLFWPRCWVESGITTFIKCFHSSLSCRIIICPSGEIHCTKSIESLKGHGWMVTCTMYTFIKIRWEYRLIGMLNNNLTASQAQAKHIGVPLVKRQWPFMNKKRLYGTSVTLKRAFDAGHNVTWHNGAWWNWKEEEGLVSCKRNTACVKLWMETWRWQLIERAEKIGMVW